jgi:hypothetical protein
MRFAGSKRLAQPWVDAVANEAMERLSGSALALQFKSPTSLHFAGVSDYQTSGMRAAEATG